MPKNKNNKKHTGAVRRKSEAAIEMEKIGLKLADDTALVGFVFSHLSISHMNYLGLISINKLCKTYAGIDICIFCQHIINPCVTLLCPAFSTSELTRWHNCPLITTSIETTIDALSSNAPVIYHYAFDPEFIDKPHMESLNLKKAFCDPRVRIIVRHESHKQLIETEFSVKVCDTIIPDCDAELLVKLVLKDIKNDNRDEVSDQDG